MFERFTDRARRVVVLAQEEARLLAHNYIGTEHILLGIVREGEGVAAQALDSLDISLPAVRTQVEEIIGHGGSAPAGHIPFTPRAKKVLEFSLREALQLGHNYIGTEHILLGLLREGEGVAAQVLVKLGPVERRRRADLATVRTRVIDLLEGTPVTKPRLRFEAGGGIPAAACAFCGQGLSEVERYVVGSGAVICNDCIAAARRAMEDAGEEGERAATMPLRVFGELPDDDAVAAIERAVRDVFGGADDEECARSLQDGKRLAPLRAEARARFPQVTETSLRLDRVRFQGADEAEIRFTIALGPGPAGLPFEGRAMRAGDRWQIARDTFCLVMQRAGVRCPPTE